MIKDSQSLWKYQLFLSVAWIPVLLLTLWQAIRYKQLKFLLQRFAFGLPPQADPSIWIHAASVGEVIAAVPLVKQLQYQFPHIPITVSTITPTGAHMVAQRLSETRHVYLPLDTKRYVKKFLKNVKPICALIMETELWPQLYTQCQLQNICLLSINARLSARTLNTNPWIRNLYHLTVTKLSAILAKSEQDAQNYLELGANPDTTHVIGNIKFAALKQSSSKPIQPLQRPYVLAASTHADEEQRITQAWIDKGVDRLLVIAPRHPDRRSAIVKQLLKITDQVAVRSHNQPVTEDTKIYLADTLGEMESFMAYADVVFMGGSLVPVGGHNILEPAQMAKPILFGPYMHNFVDECAMFLEHLAAWQVNDERELLEKLEILINSEQKRQALGHRAQILLQQQNQILDHYMEKIIDYCPALSKQ